MDKPTIYVMKTADGAPINESAVCAKHVYDETVTQTAYDNGINADDFDTDTIHAVTPEFAENNDTVCIGCNWDRAIESGNV